MHFAKIPDEPVESMPVCYIKTDTAKTFGRESSSEASSEDNSSGDSEDEQVQHLAKLQEQVVHFTVRSFYILSMSCCCLLMIYYKILFAD